ncbi:hypothetical protein ERO13_A11G229300v2 [Gossypium hirsutum]|nr:hypothetical protein ERO13_A11G229300v2 [Gossypium hirsutum]
MATLSILSNALGMLLITFLMVETFMVASAGNFNKDVDITWGDSRGKILNNGQLLTLSLDKASGSGFQSRNEYLYGKFDMQLKLVPGNSAGTVTAYYLKSQGSSWDEIDFEFLGNLSGKGDREQQFYLWFDPTADFHTYSILWNPGHVIFYVDGRPIREFKNLESLGVPYPKNQPMRMYCSLWNADDWATRGGLELHANACALSNGVSSCSTNSSSNNAWFSQELDSSSQKVLKWVQKNYMVYNYCKDAKRFPEGLPVECTVRNRKQIKI